MSEYLPDISDMTLRDWFAGQALSGLCSLPGEECTNDQAAEWAWEIADMMLAEREKRSAAQ